MAGEWHVRALDGNAHVWEVWFEGQLVGRGTEDEAWKMARAAASFARGRAFLHYRHRAGVKDLADFRENTRLRPKRFFV
jgi:hypothetical protein